MKYFELLDAYTIEDAIDAMGNGAPVIAGGTDLLGVLKDKILPEYPAVLVNIKTVHGLEYIRETDTGGVVIGANMKLCGLAESHLIKSKYPILKEAILSVASPLIRNVATIGGNICQDTRCWYYRYPYQLGARIICARKGGSNCSALSGDSRYHSIFGGLHLGSPTNRCFSVHPSDIANVLVCLNAKIHTNKKIYNADKFFLKNFIGKSKNEIVIAIELSSANEGVIATYSKFRERESIDFAVVSVASSYNVENGIIHEACIVLGAAAPFPLRLRKVEGFLRGKSINDDIAAQAAEIALEGAKPLKDNNYKVQIAKTLIKRSILKGVYTIG